MPRVSLPELEDLPWLPAWYRNFMTDCLECMIRVTGSYRATIPLLERLLQHSAEKQIIDFGSGAGGPLPGLVKELPGVPITLTDKFPNVAAFEKITASAKQNRLPISCVFEPVEMNQPPSGLKGVRTSFTSFHYIERDQALEVLQSAASAGAPLGIFECTGRAPSHFLAVAFVPLFVLVITPFLRPFSILRLLFTYVVPLVPLGCLWDGMISNFRTADPEELRSSCEHIKLEGYKFEAGTFPAAPLVRGTYLLGLPT